MEFLYPQEGACYRIVLTISSNSSHQDFKKKKLKDVFYLTKYQKRMEVKHERHMLM